MSVERAGDAAGSAANGSPWGPGDAPWFADLLRRLVTSTLPAEAAIACWSSFAPLSDRDLRREALHTVLAELRAGPGVWRPDLAGRAAWCARWCPATGVTSERPLGRLSATAAVPVLSDPDATRWVLDALWPTPGVPLPADATGVLVRLAEEAALHPADLERLQRLARTFQPVGQALARAQRTATIAGARWARLPVGERRIRARTGTDMDGLLALAQTADPETMDALLRRRALRADVQQTLLDFYGAHVAADGRLVLSPSGHKHASRRLYRQRRQDTELGALATSPGIGNAARAAAQHTLLDRLVEAETAAPTTGQRGVGDARYERRQELERTLDVLGKSWLKSPEPRSPLEADAPVLWARLAEPALSGARAMLVERAWWNRPAWLSAFLGAMTPDEVLAAIQVTRNKGRALDALTTLRPLVAHAWGPSVWQDLMTHADRDVRLGTLALRGAVVAAAAPPAP